MREMTYREIRDNLADVLNRVKYLDETIVITRHGKPEAQIGPIEETAMTDQRPAARDAIISLASRIADAVSATSVAGGVPSWRPDPDREVNEAGPRRHLSEEVLRPRLDAIAGALVTIGVILDQMDAVTRNEGHMERIAAAEGTVNPDDERVMVGLHNDRGYVLDRHLDHAALNFLRYRGLTVDGWENLLKPADTTGAARYLADAVEEYINPRDHAAGWAFHSAQKGLAALS